MEEAVIAAYFKAREMCYASELVKERESATWELSQRSSGLMIRFSHRGGRKAIVSLLF